MLRVWWRAIGTAFACSSFHCDIRPYFKSTSENSGLNVLIPNIQFPIVMKIPGIDRHCASPSPHNFDPSAARLLLLSVQEECRQIASATENIYLRRSNIMQFVIGIVRFRYWNIDYGKIRTIYVHGVTPHPTQPNDNNAICYHFLWFPFRHSKYVSTRDW